MELPNVNNLNGIPNFGHGLPEESLPVVEETHEETTEENVQAAEDGHEEEESSEGGGESDAVQ